MCPRWEGGGECIGLTDSILLSSTGRRLKNMMDGSNNMMRE